MTSKHNLKKDVEQLSEEIGSGDGGLQILYGVKHNYDTPEAAPRPELVVPDGVRGGYTTATPDAVPKEFERPVLFLTKPVVETYPGDADDSTIPVSELWDSMDDKQLREEYNKRKANGKAVPSILEKYAYE